MSYKLILNKPWVTKWLLENYHNKRITQISIATKKYYEMLRYKADEKNKIYYDRRCERKLKQKLKKEEEWYKLALKLLKDPEFKKKEKKIWLKEMKKLAFDKFQLYCRLLRCDKNQNLRLVDTLEYVHYKKAQWWHYFSKFNYPHIAFEVINCRPITQTTNQIQWDQEWLYRKENLINIIWQEKFDELLKLANSEQQKIIYDIEYYQQKFSYFDALVVKEKTRLWIIL